MITENILANLKAPTRNTIIHWSDVQVNRTLMADIAAGKSDKKYIDAVKVRKEGSKDFEPIDHLEYAKKDRWGDLKLHYHDEEGYDFLRCEFS